MGIGDVGRVFRASGRRARLPGDVTSHITKLGQPRRTAAPAITCASVARKSLPMTGRAKSKTKIRQEEVECQEKWMAHAVKVYFDEQSKGRGEKKKSLRNICSTVEEECWSETSSRIKLDKTTLARRIKGGKSQAQSNAECSWLTEAEADAIVTYATNLADQGWPLSLKRLKEHANEICRAHYGEDFEGVGQNWAKRFVERHSERLKQYWSRPLDNSRARAVNPATKEAFFKLLESTIKGEEGDEPIPPELIYGVDESGIQEGIGTRERVLGAVHKKVQHQQRSGERENITVIVTICADGTSIPPAVIFKGEGFQASWKQDNPLNASCIIACFV